MPPKRKGRRRSSFGTVFQRKGRPGYYVRIRHKGRERQYRAGQTRAEAEEYLARLWKKLRDAELFDEKLVESVTFAQLQKRLLDHWRANCTPKTVAGRTGRLNRIVDWFGATPIAEVTRADVEDFLDELRNVEGRSVATANRYAVLLSGAFKFAVKRGMATSNPAREIERPREHEIPVPYISGADVDRLVAHAGDWRFGLFVRVLADTGLRRGEGLALEWRDVDLERRTVLVRVAKGKKPRTVDLTDAAARAFQRLQEDNQPVPLRGPNLIWPEFSFRKPDAKADRTPGAVSAKFKRIAVRAGFSEMRLHDLRHAFCSRLAQAGVPLPTIKELAGHKTLATTMRYASHVPGGAGRVAVGSMERNEQTKGDQPGGQDSLDAVSQ